MKKESLGLTEQEMNFANEYVYRFFHAAAATTGMAIQAAKAAGYEVPTDASQADTYAKNLLRKVEEYTNAEIERFRDILSPGQQRNLWAHISSFKGGTPDPETACGGGIILH